MRITSVLFVAVLTGSLASRAAAEPLRCDFTQFKPAPGLTAAIVDSLLAVSWRGDANQELRLRFMLADGRPVVRDLSIRKGNGTWAVLGENLTPEYHVVTGVRRMTTQQADPLRAAGVEITQTSSTRTAGTRSQSGPTPPSAHRRAVCEPMARRSKSATPA